MLTLFLKDWLGKARKEEFRKVLEAVVKVDGLELARGLDFHHCGLCGRVFKLNLICNREESDELINVNDLVLVNVYLPDQFI